MKIALVSCSKRKKLSRCSATSMYSESTVFRGYREYARKNTDRWYILSAKYGLLSPTTEIEPYNRTLLTMNKQERIQWSEKVWASLKPKINIGDTLVFLAGVTYREYLVEMVKEYDIKVEIPYEGLRVGNLQAKLIKDFGSLSGKTLTNLNLKKKKGLF